VVVRRHRGQEPLSRLTPPVERIERSERTVRQLVAMDQDVRRVNREGLDEQGGSRLACRDVQVAARDDQRPPRVRARACRASNSASGSSADGPTRARS
jgi:hypothetical protein